MFSDPVRRELALHLLVTQDGLDERLGRLLLEEDTGLSIAHRVERATPTVRDHGAPGRHALDRDDPEILLAWKYQRPTSRVLIPQDGVGSSADEIHIRLRHAAQTLLFGTGADDNEREPELVERLYRPID